MFGQERDNLQKSQFLKAMADMWTSFGARVLRYKVVMLQASSFSIVYINIVVEEHNGFGAEDLLSNILVAELLWLEWGFRSCRRCVRSFGMR